MVDVTADMPAAPAASVHTTDAAHRRQRVRYGAEWRFKMAGALAIVLATLALVSLLWTVLFNAAGALRKTYVSLPVQFDRDVLGLSADQNSPDEIRGGNFTGISRKSLRAALPSVKGRSNRRALYSLLSDGAALSLRADAMADPTLLGQTKDVALLASDDVDLWIKGYVDRVEVVAGRGLATPQPIEDGVRISVGANTFQGIVNEIKAALQERAEQLKRQASAEQRGVDHFTDLAQSTSNEEKKKEYLERVEIYKQRVAGLMERSKGLEARTTAANVSLNLTTALPSHFVRLNGGVVKIARVRADTVEGTAILPLKSMDTADAGAWELLEIAESEDGRRISDKQAIWLDKLQSEGRVTRVFNWAFFKDSNSREAELAGVWGAIVGSFWTMLVTFLLAFPIGVMAAIYLEEFAAKNAITDFIEVNINNLAAVPSIVFGLLGLAVFVSFFGVPRSTALAGGIVLALMTLPTIIIAARAAIKAVPPSIRQAALGVGASKVQTVTHHVLPLAMPGILTGTIIGMAQALGETAPLLMIGMFAFIREIPTGVTEPATALPVQVYQWSDFPEQLFTMKTGLAIVVLLGFLIIMNAIAIILRKRFERRW